MRSKSQVPSGGPSGAEPVAGGSPSFTAPGRKPVRARRNHRHQAQAGVGGVEANGVGHHPRRVDNAPLHYSESRATVYQGRYFGPQRSMIAALSHVLNSSTGQLAGPEQQPIWPVRSSDNRRKMRPGREVGVRVGAPGSFERDALQRQPKHGGPQAQAME